MVCLGNVGGDTVDGASQQGKAQRLDYGGRIGFSRKKYGEKIDFIIVASVRREQVTFSLLYEAIEQR